MFSLILTAGDNPPEGRRKIHGDVISNPAPALGLKGQETEVLHSDLVDAGCSEGESCHRDTLGCSTLSDNCFTEMN